MVPPAAVTTAVLEALEAQVALAVLVASEVLGDLAALDIMAITTDTTRKEFLVVPVPWATAPASRNSVHRASVPTITRLHTTTSKDPGPDLVVQAPTTVLDSGLDLDLRDTMDLLVVLVVQAVSVVLDRLISDIMVVLMGTMGIMVIMVITDRYV